MSAAMRFFWMATLMVFIGGCSSYRVVPFPCIEEEVDMTAGKEVSVKAGETVRITMRDSGQVEGRIVSVSAEAVTLEPIELATYALYVECNGNLAADYRPRVIAADSIRVIEVKGISRKTSFLVAGGLLAASVVALAATADFSMDMPSLGQ